MTITAKYGSTCPSCSKRIEPGTRVEWTRGEKARHVSCSTATAPAAAPSSTSTASWVKVGEFFRVRAPGAKTGDVVTVVAKSGKASTVTLGSATAGHAGVFDVGSEARRSSSGGSRNECGSSHRGRCCVSGGMNLSCGCGAECCGEND